MSDTAKSNLKPDPAVVLKNPLWDLRLRKPPFWLSATLIVLIVISWIPLVFIARARMNTSTQPRIHIFQDMGNQPKYKPQSVAVIFADGRSDRIAVPGTVARGHLDTDDHFDHGFARTWNAQASKWDVQFYEEFPQQIKIDAKTLARGQERFNIYCTPCHGYDGMGAGMIHTRAQELKQSAWVPPTNLVSDAVKVRQTGHIYNSVTQGIRSMAGYGSQISTEDRWAIVAYVRSLQLAYNVPAESLPQGAMEQMPK
jgi:mono/diheme cytochrome c family protein